MNGAHLTLWTVAAGALASRLKKRGSRYYSLDYVELQPPSIRNVVTGRTAEAQYEIPIVTVMYDLEIENVPTQWDANDVDGWVRAHLSDWNSDVSRDFRRDVARHMKQDMVLQDFVDSDALEFQGASFRNDRYDEDDE
ncbi:hypothetical protein CMI47_00720 [Candidatus Pacearchaeota archaeon]|jgi:hypothetical protein|nr:hypothetical protein [Candidatus Pacearchaeota archaeon]MDP6386894.1 hypothetical protein [Planctomycetota bacterium]|tara:strand:- start:1034 stop:1447 length:414 start_codon:yes stop_codon:yes gene_type:complete